MGFSFRKSFTLIPGVRVTVSNRGVSVSAGPRGARISASSRGKITRTLSIPGTGIRHIRTIRPGSKRKPSMLGILLRGLK